MHRSIISFLEEGARGLRCARIRGLGTSLGEVLRKQLEEGGGEEPEQGGLDKTGTRDKRRRRGEGT